MAKIKNKTLSQLFMQLRFAPTEQKQKELKGARSLLPIIDCDKQYPVEFICFKITGYRPREDLTGIFVSGDELTADLHAFIIRLSRQLEMPASKQAQPVYSADDLCKKFSISSKTLSRWRTRGLVAMTFVFDDGAKRLGFLQSDVDAFTRIDPAVLERASKFTQMTDAEKDTIIERTLEIVKQGYSSRASVIRQVANETSRSQEAIRSLLVEYEKQTAKQIFKKPSGMITPRDAATIYNLKKQGMTIPELMEMFSRSRSSIHRIINTRRAKTLHGRKIEFIDSVEFMQEDADQIILTQSPELVEFLNVATKSFKRLSKQLEVELFRCYNYLKYLACLRQRQIDLHRPSGKRLDQIAAYLDRAEAVKNIIVEANLGLVVSIAKKHLTTGASMPDLVSEGNFSLMRAIDGFDYTRGYRFSTYGSLAISKDFARMVPQEADRPDRPGHGDIESFEQNMRLMQTADVVDIERAHRSLDIVIKENLTQREQYIVCNHFGLAGDRLTNKAKTLKQIGQTLSLSKERVRQIELIALQQLRQCLSPEEFDLLTK